MEIWKNTSHNIILDKAVLKLAITSNLDNDRNSKVGANCRHVFIRKTLIVTLKNGGTPRRMCHFRFLWPHIWTLQMAGTKAITLADIGTLYRKNYTYNCTKGIHLVFHFPFFPNAISVHRMLVTAKGHKFSHKYWFILIFSRWLRFAYESFINDCSSLLTLESDRFESFFFTILIVLTLLSRYVEMKRLTKSFF